MRKMMVIVMLVAFVFAMIPVPAAAFAQSCERYMTCSTVFSCVWYGANCAGFHPEEWSWIISGGYDYY
jgi:hypothetical protein